VRSVINEEGDLGTETGHPGLNSWRNMIYEIHITFFFSLKTAFNPFKPKFV
jgi:hypothetical protein